MESWHALALEISAWLGVLLILVTIPCVLAIKKESTSAVAWCLLVFFFPIGGSLLFALFGYQSVHRPLKRKQKHQKAFRFREPSLAPSHHASAQEQGSLGTGMARLARRFGAFPMASGNRVSFYFEGQPAYEAMLEAIGSARDHIHLQSFIFQPDDTGRRFLEALTLKAREGVAVRLLFDAMGSHRLHRAALKPLVTAGGKCFAFLPLGSLRRRIQINLRNHRKIMIVDGKLGFTGGLNIGDEYLGKNPRFGYWRDTHLRLAGPAVAGLQSVFVEDWDFAAGEILQGPSFFPNLAAEGPESVQVIPSGPDLTQKSIREIYFAAILGARKRLWIATPYYVPDAGLRDAICLAAHLGIDVRLLCQYHPDKWIPFFCGRYYWPEAIEAGVKIYQYTRGMLHSKVILVDDGWASVGTANLDNRSLHLNFEVNCLIYSSALTAELEAAFQRDLTYSIRLNQHAFAQRPMAGRMVENACRLLSPIL